MMLATALWLLVATLAWAGAMLLRLWWLAGCDQR